MSNIAEKGEIYLGFTNELNVAQKEKNVDE